MRGWSSRVLRTFSSLTRAQANTASTSTATERTGAGRPSLFRRELEERVVETIMSSSSPVTPAATSTSTRHTVVPMPLIESTNKATSNANQPLIRIDRGVFESLLQKDDIFQRSGFDRVVQTQLDPTTMLLGVIDGHGHSALCAEYLAESFPLVIKLLLEKPPSRFHQPSEHAPSSQTGDDSIMTRFYCDALREAFHICSREWDTSPQIRSNAHYRHSGAVALFALVSQEHNKMYLASAGDCRALTSMTTGRGWKFLHSAHRTDSIHERLRVLRQGGRIRSVNGVLRVQGSLMPTRVFGDVELKIDFFGRMKPFLDPIPDLATVDLTPSSSLKKTDTISSDAWSSFSIVATDGLWDSLSTESIVEMCKQGLAKGKNAEQVAEMLGTTAMQTTDDDVTVMVIFW